MAVPSVTALRQAIRSFLDEEGDTPSLRGLAAELRKIDTSLGTAVTRDDNPSPGRLAARQAGAPEKKSEGAKPDAPGADLNDVPRPGGEKPFAGIKRPETARALAALRFATANAEDKQVHTSAQGKATASAKGDHGAIGVGRE